MILVLDRVARVCVCALSVCAYVWVCVRVFACVYVCFYVFLNVCMSSDCVLQDLYL